MGFGFLALVFGVSFLSVAAIFLLFVFCACRAGAQADRDMVGAADYPDTSRSVAADLGSAASRESEYAEWAEYTNRHPIFFEQQVRR